MKQEEGLHLFVADALRLYAADGVIWFHPANEGPRSKRYASKLKRLGVLAGVADLVIVVEGKACFLEGTWAGQGEVLGKNVKYNETSTFKTIKTAPAIVVRWD